ncbi:DUF349 domain-containing protein [Candidatus Thiothrix sp. Deng01]|uniref:DUF349 domain-containing protein n=1 Tax=Candidatus Thiothrix phosphatis TaxID=3112415 RepID=A0ABU6D3M8_9GAMM|nr:DUF349 domain-containing protein [Candidatus Thiothrix sp. Deng01]MEB4592924.1 DUF349 domain-containing protein [Candidatus Thiothrix sp. Deng01]
MLGNFFKPKWQHADEKVRIQALDSLAGDSIELIRLAQTDPHSAVRMKAIERLTHLPTLVQLGHAPGSIGERAKQRIVGLAATDRHHDNLLADIFQWLQTPDLLKSIANDPGRGVKLRHQAISIIDDQELLFTIASNDPSREIQYIAAKHLQDFEKLKTLEKTHAKNNKRLRQLIKERIEDEQQHQQQLAEIEDLCTEAENLGGNGSWEQDKTRLKVLQQGWRKLACKATATQQQRFLTAEETFMQRLGAHEMQETNLRPIRENRQQLLSAATELLHQLQAHPELLNLSTLDANLASLAQGWEQQEKLPIEEQAKLETAWRQQRQQMIGLRNAIADDLQALETLAKLDEKANGLKEQKRPIHSKDILSLQTEWTSSKRPRAMRNRLSELEQHFHRSIAALNNRLEKQKQQQENTLQALRESLAKLESHLENEQYGEAIEIHKALTVDLKETALPSKDTAFVHRRLQMLAPFLREIQDWRRWGTDQVRKQLIESAEHLREEDDIDPQERAQKIQTLREEWRKLAHMEPSQQRALWKEFDSTVTAAYEPSKQYFAKQAQQRDSNLEQRQAICIQLEAMDNATDWVNVDWRSLQTQLNQLRKQWKDIGAVSHRDWKAINGRFNAAMDALEIHFKAERARNWQEREQLVAQAKALLDTADTAQAIEQAKRLQTAWHITLASRSSDEQRLWKQFREPMDMLFARAREERQQQQQEHKTQLEENAKQAAEQRQRELERQQQQLAELDALAEASSHHKQVETSADQQIANRSTGELLCLQLEVLLGLETPVEFQQARMKYQVSQLSEAMLSRKETSNPSARALPLLKQWYALGGMPAITLAGQTARIEKIRQALLP